MEDNEQVFLYIKEEIEALAKEESDTLYKEAKEIKEHIIATASANAASTFAMKKEREIITIKNDIALELSKEQAKYTKKIIQERTVLVDSIFDEVVKKLMKYKETTAYITSMNTCFTKTVKQYSLEDYTIYCNDEVLINEFSKISTATIESDASIIIGGFKIKCNQRNIVFTNTYDAMLDHQKEKFGQNEEMKIK